MLGARNEDQKPTHMAADLEGELRELGLGGAQAALGALSGRADDYINAGGFEMAWAMKAIKYAETHFKLIQSVDATTLTLTRRDEEIFQKFRKKFAEMEVDKINSESLKSPEAKEEWRKFCEEFKGMIQDYNYGTLLRLDTSQDYSEENTILVPRVQFLAVEIVRNRQGLNSVHFSPKS